MRKAQVFKYFDDPHRNAAFTDKPCQVCGSSVQCLEGEFFDRGDQATSVCLDCLQAGKMTVHIPDFVKEKIAGHKGIASAMLSLEELSRTPPVPWIQHNQWPVCCSDWCKYVGEWDADEIVAQAPHGDGRKYLLSILDRNSLGRIEDPEAFWKSIGFDTAIFVFRCLSCDKRVAVAQGY